MLYVDFVEHAILDEYCTEPHKPGWYVVSQVDAENDDVFGPRFLRKKDAELFAAGLREKGVESYEHADALTDEEWAAIRRELLSRLQW